MVYGVSLLCLRHSCPVMGLHLCPEGQEAPKAIRRNRRWAGPRRIMVLEVVGKLGRRRGGEEQQDRRLSGENGKRVLMRGGLEPNPTLPAAPNRAGALCVCAVHILHRSPVILHETLDL